MSQGFFGHGRAAFLGRPEADLPEPAWSGRQRFRTAKYAYAVAAMHRLPTER